MDRVGRPAAAPALTEQAGLPRFPWAQTTLAMLPLAAAGAAAAVGVPS
ncbi:MAG TPA: hypothetical protein VKW76_13305 [Candidatus Binatia bacterium]|nr:hypothetical protein [Candidatus Binatia bacterium]